MAGRRQLCANSYQIWQVEDRPVKKYNIGDLILLTEKSCATLCTGIILSLNKDEYWLGGGYYIINVCKEVYGNVLKGLFGEPHEVFPLKKSKRQNNYTEMVYVWHKSYL